jgi:hypothetical protein
MTPPLRPHYMNLHANYANAHVDTEQGEDANADLRDSYETPIAPGAQLRP